MQTESIINLVGGQNQQKSVTKQRGIGEKLALGGKTVLVSDFILVATCRWKERHLASGESQTQKTEKSAPAQSQGLRQNRSQQHIEERE